MRSCPMRWAVVSLLIAAIIGACGEDGEPEAKVAFFMGGIAQIDTTVCAAERERRGGTNVVTVRDHSRHHPRSVVMFEDGYETEAEGIASRLAISSVTAMDAVTPTLFEEMDVAVIVGADHRCP
jgi:hypothetical protein